MVWPSITTPTPLAPMGTGSRCGEALDASTVWSFTVHLMVWRSPKVGRNDAGWLPTGSRLGGAGCGSGTGVPSRDTVLVVGTIAAPVWLSNPSTATSWPPPTSTTPLTSSSRGGASGYVQTPDTRSRVPRPCSESGGGGQGLRLGTF